MFVVYVGQNGFNHLGNFEHQVFLGTTGCDGRSTQTDAGSLESRAAVKRNHVFVYGDVGRYQRFLGNLTGQIGIFAAQVHQHGVVVRTAGNNSEATVHQGLCQDSGIFLHLLGIFFPFRLQDFAEGNGFGCDDMFQRTTLDTGEYG